MHKFAHISDCHLGANRDPVLQKLELEAFDKAFTRCSEEKVDFIVVSGDLFHSNIPDMGVTNQAVKRMREIRNKGIPIYLVYGSHDYSPNETSIVDILDSAGLFTKIVKGRIEKGKLRLEFTTDPKTKAKIVGISARKIGMEEKYFEILDRKSLEKEEGFKVFVFHSALSEFKPDFLARMTSVPISYFPQGFNYYAGGHIHKRIEASLPGYSKIVYPGPLFAGYPRDLERSAQGEKRGFHIVSFDTEVKKVEFVEISVCEYVFFEYDAAGKTAPQVQRDLLEGTKKLEVAGKVVLLKIVGELSGGKTADIDFAQIRKLLVDNGALHVNINRFGLTSREFTTLKMMGEDAREIETKLLKESIDAVRVSVKDLKGEKGAQLAFELLNSLRLGQKPNENKKDYEERVVSQTLGILKLTEAFQ